jgi:hypothetical protein
MSQVDPFASSTPEILSGIVKNLEKRWGLTLVSFLPPEAQEGVVQLQYEVSKLWNGQPDAGMREARPYVEFYAPEQFHCTHLTLRRSTPKGPIQRRAFVREGHDLFELFEQVHEVTSRIRPIRIELDRMSMSHDRLGVVLLGECADEGAVRQREKLLAELNRTLGESFDVSMRSWDSDPAQFGELHCTLGYLKRPAPQSYEAFVEEIGNVRFQPIEFALESVSVVHHRYRSLAYPQEGEVRFPLGQKVDMPASEFVDRMDLAP